MTDRIACALTLLAGGLLLVVPVRAQTADLSPDVEQAARTAAQEWLELIDEADYEESWEEASPLFRERIDAGVWKDKNQSLVDSIGGPARRTLTSIQAQDSIRTAGSAGPFVVIKYRTRFSDGHFEELLVLGESEDEWRVVGYQVSPLRPKPPQVSDDSTDPSSR